MERMSDTYRSPDRMVAGQWSPPGSDRTEEVHEHRRFGSGVTTSIPDESTVMGVPGRVTRTIEGTSERNQIDL